MKASKFLWVGPLIGFILGCVIFYNDKDLPFILGGAIMALAFFVVQFSGQAALSGMHNYATRIDVNDREGMDTVITLLAAMVKVDGRVTDQEKALVKERIAAYFSEEKTKKWFSHFEQRLEEKLKIADYCEHIAYNFNEEAKSDLIYTLVRLATIDGILTDSEDQLLKFIAAKSNMNLSELILLLKQFEFQRQYKYQEKSNQYAQQHYTPENVLASAYSLLGIAESATEDEIKKAYRNLAKDYHPDSSPLSKEIAKEKFQTLVDAYELIKTKKGFS